MSDTVWLVTSGLLGSKDSDVVSAAFSNRESAKAFEECHNRWMKNMKIDGYTDCYPVALNPDYTDEGYVLVETTKKKVKVRPLLHVYERWLYRGQDNEVVREDETTWVIVKAINLDAAKEKALLLFDRSTTEESLEVQR